MDAFSYSVQGHARPVAGGWSSTIGIVTAIAGNILISFALNIQRYAHMKLAREGEAGSDIRLQRGKGKDVERRQNGNVLNRRGDTEASYHKRSHAAGIGRPAPVEASERDSLLPYHENGSSIKPATDDEAADAAATETNYLSSPYWWLGIILMTVGEAGNFLAYGFAPASIVSPLGVVALVSNCVIAPVMLKEPFRFRDFLGVVVAVCGAVTVALSATDNNPQLGPNEIWKLIATWEFETYLAVSSSFILVLALVSNKYGSLSIFIDLGLVGLLGGYTALATKGVASLLSYTLWRALTFPLTYLLAAVLVSSAVMQIKYVNRALQRFDSTQVIPTQFVLFTLSVILGSAILYRDFEKKPGDDAGEFVGGCLLTFIGVWLITSGRQDSNGTDSDTDTLENGSGEIATEEGMGKHSELPYGFIRDGSMGDVSSHQVKADRIRTNQEPTGTQASTASETHTSRLGPQMPNEQPSYEWSVSEPSVTVPRLKSAKSADDTVSYELPSQSILRPAKEDQDEIEHPMTDQQHPDPTKSKAARFIPATPPAHGNSLRRPTPDRGGSLARRSFANMVPGPLTSPLSSSLSAVVADSLRRGAEVGLTKHEQLKSRLRAISPTTRYTAHKHMALPDEDAEVEADSPTRPSASRVVPCESTASADAPHSVSCRRQSEHDNDERMHKQLLRPGIRARSLSTTVAGYFRRDRGRARRNDLSNIS